MTLAFPKPKDAPRTRASVAVLVRGGGREVCLKNRPGRSEYKWRTREMVERQGDRCCLQDYAPGCPGRLMWEQATFDHEHGRGAGKTDERIEIPDPDHPGKTIWQNGACHAWCNTWKGSRYIDYNRSFQK